MPLFEDPLASLTGNSVIVIISALLVAHINTAHVLIRRRTMLPPAIILLLFSCLPMFMQMSPGYISVLCLLYVINILFTVYNANEKPVGAFRVAFVLSLGSLFAPVMLVYIPLSWVALAMMRCLNFKSFLAAGLGILIIYFPVFSFYIFSDHLDLFLKPYLPIQDLNAIPLLQFDYILWGGLSFFTVLLGLIVGNNYINSYKDKIRVRAYLSLLSFITITATLLFLFLDINPDVNLYIAVGAGSLLLSHFFALVDRKSGTVLFYVFILLLLAVCILSFTGIL
ncbi:MAG: hypothetical protein LBL79_11900 [Prevotella sp.]|nr:hypothetical protein [Prevotella sp.]